ncbi:hypothetical protein RND81_08G132900 [Saponaria officinalis]|uniref:Ubiquitin-like protease family profile domain-containing protein n=1 Tax=Saponaria officinalis TaxID=3572 RepID=A0AAW1J6V3_SAPOF
MHRAPSNHTVVEDEDCNRGSAGEQPQDVDLVSDEITDCGDLYNTAEIIEVLWREQKTSADSCLKEPPKIVTNDIQRADLEEAGYTSSEVNKSMKLVEEMNVTVPEVGAVPKGAADSVGNSRSTPSSDKVPQITIVHHPFDLQPALPQSWIGEGSCKRRRTSTTGRLTPDAAVGKLHLIEALSPVSTRRRGRGDGLGYSLDCGEATGASLLVVSNYLRNNMSLFKNVKDWRKHVTDYCFLDDGDLLKEEILIQYGTKASLQREDVLTMLPSRLTSSAVIDCWAMLLNMIESEENKKQKMAFFGLRHTDVLPRLMETPTQCTPSDSYYDMLFKEWDAYVEECGRTINLESDMIFIPLMVDNHIACVCINFNSKTADILDNQIHTDPTKSDVCKAAEIIASTMSDYLDYKGIGKGCEITGFEHRQIKFEWTRPTPNDEESGIFTMVHMLLYEGQTFTHDDLGGKISRRYLVLQMAAALVLADINKIRYKVLDDVTRWVARKDSILVTLKAKRKIVQILARSRKTQ